MKRKSFSELLANRGGMASGADLGQLLRWSVLWKLQHGLISEKTYAACICHQDQVDRLTDGFRQWRYSTGGNL